MQYLLKETIKPIENWRKIKFATENLYLTIVNATKKNYKLIKKKTSKNNNTKSSLTQHIETTDYNIPGRALEMFGGVVKALMEEPQHQVI